MLKQKLLHVLIIASIPLNAAQASAFSDALDKAKQTLNAGQQGMDAATAWNKFKKGDKPAFNVLVRLAKQGNPAAQNYVGWILDNGANGNQPDHKMALRFFQAASKLPLAAYNVGIMTFLGRGTDANEQAAIPYFITAANDQIEQAQVWLTVYYYKAGKKDDAFRWATEAARQSDRLGTYYLARMLVEQKQYKNALENGSKAAELYSADAAILVAYLYENGQGTGQSKKMALAYRLIASGIKNGRIIDPGRFAGLTGISELDAEQGRGFASNWMENHKKPTLVDYRVTLAEKMGYLQSRFD
jgi:TPR repeat protein